ECFLCRQPRHIPEGMLLVVGPKIKSRFFQQIVKLIFLQPLNDKYYAAFQQFFNDFYVIMSRIQAYKNGFQVNPSISTISKHCWINSSAPLLLCGPSGRISQLEHIAMNSEGSKNRRVSVLFFVNPGNVFLVQTQVIK
ncbi:MAG: hypothetical protein WCS73_06060, partial [Lentisphaeria bacterium]